MLYHKDVINFIHSNREHNIGACNFFYKSVDGCYIDSDRHTAYVAGVSENGVANRMDIELDWAVHSKVYLEGDSYVTRTLESMIRIDPCLGFDKKDTHVLCYKHSVVSETSFLPAGVFGLSLHINQMTHNEVNQVAQYFNNSLGTNIFLNSEPKINHYSGFSFSDRERQCAKYLCLGMTAKEIGQKLFLSYRTVEHYIAQMKEKLNVSKKSQLVQLLMKEKLD